MPGGAAKVPAGDKREAILSAALELFAVRGFDGTAVPEVAERAGVGAGTIYRHFASKEALVNALYQRHKGALVAALTDDFPADAAPRQQLHAFWTRATDWARTRPAAIQFLELHHHGRYLDETSRALEAEILQIGVAFFQEAIHRGAIKPFPPELLIALVWGAFTGMIRAAAQGHLALTEAVVSQGEQCCWEAIRA